MELQVHEMSPGIETHVHFRGPNEGGGEDPSMMHKVVNETTSWCDHALPMPNPVPPILTAADEVNYYDQYMIVNKNPYFRPIRCMQLTERTSTSDIERAAKNGVKTLKAYPFGMTHNSENGISNYWTPNMQDKYQCAVDNGLMLCLHPEYPDAELYWEERERAFVERVLWWMAYQFQELMIGVEHISHRDTISAVQRIHVSRGRIWGGITVLHMKITANDVVGGLLDNSNFCKPMAKRPEDRKAIQEAVLRCAEPDWNCFGMGLDSAPHMASAKQAGKPGSFQARTALGLIADFYEENGKLSHIDAFTSRNARRIHNLPPPERTIKIVKSQWIPDLEFRGVPQFWAGKKIGWQLMTE